MFGQLWYAISGQLPRIYGCESIFIHLYRTVSASSVAEQKFGGVKRFEGAKMFDFRRKTLFCLGYRLSKHKMTIYSKHLGAIVPLAPLEMPMASARPKKFLVKYKCWNVSTTRHYDKLESF